MNWTAANCVKESDQDLDSSFFTLLAPVLERGTMDVISEFANPFPAAATMGVPAEDYAQLKLWSADFAEILKTVEDMTAYFHERVAEERKPGEGLIHSLLRAEVDGDRLSEEEVVANCIITMTGGRETTTNLIASGLLTLLRHPAEFGRLGTDSSLMLSAIEELLRFETLSQHTGRIAPQDVELGRKQIRAGDAVLAVMAAANRDPQRFPEPDRLDLARTDNCHTAFGWGSHCCFGAPLARLEAQIAFDRLIRLPNLRLAASELTRRTKLGLLGLTALPVAFDPHTVSDGTAQPTHLSQISGEGNE